VTSTGVLAGAAIGGAGNKVKVGNVRVEQQVTLAEQLRRLVDELRLDAELTAEQRKDVQAVASAASHAEEGQKGAVRRALAGVGGWVLDVARRIGADLVVRELEHFT